MKVLFIFPPKENWALREVKLHKKIDEESGHYPPLGILYVATYLLKNTNHQVKIIDCPAEEIRYDSLEQQIKNFFPDVVGIYFCTEYLLDSLKTAQLVKKIKKDTIVVAGGPHIFIYPKQTIKNEYVDYCIFGEGEIVFTEFINALDTAKDIDSIPGVISKRNLYKEHVLQKVPLLDILPYPERSLLDIKKYKSFITYSNPITTMMTSRGCAYNCYYCNSIERAQKVRFHSAEYVVKEMESIINLGIRDILFFDENFTFDIKRVEDICDEIISKKIKVRWHCRSRADMKLDKRILKKMKDAGCRLIQFGIETGSQRLQKVINKNLDLERVKQVVKMCKDVGILVYGNFMLGLPTETKEEMLQTINFAIELGLDYAPFGVFNPLPESVFYIHALKEKIIKKDYWLEYVENPEESMKDYWWPKHDKNFLNEMNYLAFKKFYFRPTYILKALFRKQALKQKLWQAKAAIKLFL